MLRPFRFTANVLFPIFIRSQGLCISPSGIMQRYIMSLCGFFNGSIVRGYYFFEIVTGFKSAGFMLWCTGLSELSVCYAVIKSYYLFGGTFPHLRAISVCFQSWRFYRYSLASVLYWTAVSICTCRNFEKSACRYFRRDWSGSRNKSMKVEGWRMQKRRDKFRLGVFNFVDALVGF